MPSPFSSFTVLNSCMRIISESVSVHIRYLEWPLFKPFGSQMITNSSHLSIDNDGKIPTWTHFSDPVFLVSYRRKKNMGIRGSEQLANTVIPHGVVLHLSRPTPCRDCDQDAVISSVSVIYHGGLTVTADDISWLHWSSSCNGRLVDC